MKVLMLVMNTFENDSRVHRAAKTLVDNGADVTLLCLHREGLPRLEEKHGYKVIRKSLENSYSEGNSDALYQRVNKLKNTNKIIFLLLWPLYWVGRALYATSLFLVNLLKIVKKSIAITFRFIKQIVSLAKRLVAQVKNLVGRVVNKMRGMTIRTLDYLSPGLFAEIAFEMRKRKYEAFAHEALLFARDMKPTVVHAHDFNCLLAANKIWQELKVPFVYDSHELWVERNRPVIAEAKNEREWEFAEEKDAIKNATFSITVCDSIADHLKEAYQIDRPLVVRNTPDRKKIVRNPAKNLRAKLKFTPTDFVCVYLGIIAKNRGVTDILNALPLVDKRVKFVAMGAMNPHFQDTFYDLITKNKLDERAFHHEPVPAHEISTWIADLDLSLTTMNQTCLSYVYTLPNKLFESLQAELPVIGPNSPEIIRIVEHYNCGLIYKDTDSVDLAKKINELVGNHDKLMEFKDGARRAAQDLCWENEQNRLVSAYSASFNFSDPIISIKGASVNQ